jgi:hypothetical protein
MPIAKDNRRQGQWVEALFVARATATGLNVSKPWGAYRYDFLVEREGHTARVQVKSCSYRRNGYYNCIYQAKRRRYTADEFDFVAIYVIPEDVWYVLPMAEVARLGSIIVLSPHLPHSKYDAYKEAWQLLRSKSAQALSARAGGGGC